MDDDLREAMFDEIMDGCEPWTPGDNRLFAASDVYEICAAVAARVEREVREECPTRIEKLERVLRDLLEEYDDRKAQFGDDYLWKKHEFTETVTAARAALEEASDG
jgi:hypothetical protein